jgi:hypothetical protein
LTKLASLAAGACTLALAGAAYAGEPLSLTETEMDGVTAGQFGVDFYENKQIYVDVFKFYEAYVYLDGTSAQSTGQATAQSYNGEDVLAEVANYSDAYANGPYYYAAAAGTAISAIDSNN